MLLAKFPVLLAAAFVAVPLGISSALPYCANDSSEPVFPMRWRSADDTAAFMRTRRQEAVDAITHLDTLTQAAPAPVIPGTVAIRVSDEIKALVTALGIEVQDTGDRKQKYSNSRPDWKAQMVVNALTDCSNSLIALYDRLNAGTDHDLLFNDPVALGTMQGALRVSTNSLIGYVKIYGGYLLELADNAPRVTHLDPATAAIERLGTSARVFLGLVKPFQLSSLVSPARTQAIHLSIDTASSSCLKGQSEPEIQPEAKKVFRKADLTIDFLTTVGTTVAAGREALREVNAGDHKDGATALVEKFRDIHVQLDGEYEATDQGRKYYSNVARGDYKATRVMTAYENFCTALRALVMQIQPTHLHRDFAGDADGWEQIRGLIQQGNDLSPRLETYGASIMKTAGKSPIVERVKGVHDDTRTKIRLLVTQIQGLHVFSSYVNDLSEPDFQITKRSVHETTIFLNNDLVMTNLILTEMDAGTRSPSYVAMHISEVIEAFQEYFKHEHDSMGGSPAYSPDDARDVMNLYSTFSRRFDALITRLRQPATLKGFTDDVDAKRKVVEWKTSLPNLSGLIKSWGDAMMAHCKVAVAPAATALGAQNTLLTDITALVGVLPTTVFSFELKA